MAVQKQSMPSFASMISVLSIVFYCAGFLRVELELHEHKKRINALESIADPAKPPSNDPDIIKNSPRINCNTVQRHIRQVDSTENMTEAKGTTESILEMKKLLLEMRALQSQPNGVTFSLGPPGPPGPPGPRGHKGARGRRGQKGRTGNKGDKGIMVSTGKSGKQGIAGPAGLKGETGTKGEKGDKGLTGMRGSKGDTGATGMPGIKGVIGLMGMRGSKGNKGARGLLGTKGDKGTKGTPGNKGDKGATGMTGTKGEPGECIPRAHPRVSLYPGPSHVIQGSNVTLPTCHATGYPEPVVTWRKSLGQLPQGRAQYNNSMLQITDVRKIDSDTYICSAVNLLGSVEMKTLLVVVSLPAFTIKPPGKVFAAIGDTLMLNCSATGDPQPVISWKRKGGALPAGRSHMTNEALIIRDLKEEDAGIYVCVATSAGVFDIEEISDVEVELVGTDCSNLFKSGHTQSGLYFVNPDGRGHFTVYCDMRTDGGGWTVFQRRKDGSEDFYRGWNGYKAGFGQLPTEFWLGNDKIHRLTAFRPSSLRVELEDWNGVKAYAKYGKFNIGDEQAQYRLEVDSYSGTAGDSLAYHNNRPFTTKDRDNDDSNCAVSYTGAWWYKGCHYSNLNVPGKQN